LKIEDLNKIIGRKKVVFNLKLTISCNKIKNGEVGLMKKLLVVLVAMFFLVGCSTMKISGVFNMLDGSTFQFDNGKIKISNKEAIIKTKTVDTKIDMKKVKDINITIE
jgi:hypothetical protein